MNRHQVSGQWKQLRGKVKEKWRDLTDDDLDKIEGKRDQLIGKIQQKYGIAKPEAEMQVDKWANELIEGYGVDGQETTIQYRWPSATIFKQ